MVKEELSEYGEVNLVQLFRILSKGKKNILISTLISLILGFIFGFYNKYKAKINLFPGNEFEFTKYKIVDEVLNANFQLSTSNIAKKIAPSSSSILDEFIIEFNDRKEIIEVLKNKGFSLYEDPKSDAKYIADLAKNFYINQDKLETGIVSEIIFIWDDPKEGLEILEESLDMTLETVRDNNINNIQEIISLVEAERKFVVNKIFLDSEVALIDAKAYQEKTIDYISQQKKLANDLGVYKNRFDPMNNSVYNGYGYMDYYLRGFKSLESDLLRIESLTDEQLLLDKDISTQKMIQSKNLKSEFITKELKDSLLLFNNDSYKKWIKYNTNLILIRPIKSKSLIIATFLIAGLIFSSFYEIVKFQIKKSL